MSSEETIEKNDQQQTEKKPKSGLVFAIGMLLLLTMLVYLNMG
jgi:hypothetical protein